MLRGAARDVFRRLMDAVDPDLVDTAEPPRATFPASSRSRARMRWIGHRLRADADLDMDPDLGVSQGHDVATAAGATMKEALPQLDALACTSSPGAWHRTDADSSSPAGGRSEPFPWVCALEGRDAAAPVWC